MRRICFTCILPLAFVAATAAAQEKNNTNPPPSNTLANLPVQRIGPNDLIAVSIYEAPEFSKTLRVSSEGRIRIPMIAKPLNAGGLFPSELETAIADELKKAQLLVDPIVTVTILEYQSHPISVAGAVKNPVTFQATTPVTLIEALTRAGGLSPDAGSDVLVSRRQAADAGNEPIVLTQRIPVKKLIDGADPTLNVTLTGGEEIRVPEAGKVFVVGMVKKPGAYPIQDGSETSLLQILAVAEGLEGVHSPKAFIYRTEATGKRNEIPVDLKNIMKRKAPDVALEASDILYIPEDARKRLGLSALEKAVLFAAPVTAALIYAGR